MEHIRNYDKITVTRQLSVEVQDSIHRWERRRTLNKARASRSSVQVTPGAPGWEGAGGTAPKHHHPHCPPAREPDRDRTVTIYLCMKLWAWQGRPTAHMSQGLQSLEPGTEWDWDVCAQWRALGEQSRAVKSYADSLPWHPGHFGPEPHSRLLMALGNRQSQSWEARGSRSGGILY